MAKRISGPPRRPRNPVAKAVRTPAFRPRVVPDKRWQETLRQSEKDDDQSRRRSQEEDEDDTSSLE